MISYRILSLRAQLQSMKEEHDAAEVLRLQQVDKENERLRRGMEDLGYDVVRFTKFKCEYADRNQSEDEKTMMGAGAIEGEEGGVSLAQSDGFYFGSESNHGNENSVMDDSLSEAVRMAMEECVGVEAVLALTDTEGSCGFITETDGEADDGEQTEEGQQSDDGEETEEGQQSNDHNQPKEEQESDTDTSDDGELAKLLAEAQSLRTMLEEAEAEEEKKSS